MTDCVYFLLYFALGKLSFMLLINYYYYVVIHIINTVDYDTTFYILDRAHKDAILGSDFLTKYLTQINLFNNTIVLGNTEAIINNCTNIKLGFFFYFIRLNLDSLQYRTAYVRAESCLPFYSLFTWTISLHYYLRVE